MVVNGTCRDDVQVRPPFVNVISSMQTSENPDVVPLVWRIIRDIPPKQREN